MNIKMKLVFGLFLGASSLVAWPLIRNEIAYFQLRRATLDGYLTVWDQKRVKHGPVRLNETQKQALLNSLDWDYFRLRGYPLCMTMQELHFSAPNEKLTISIYPNCGIARFAGWTNAIGYMPGGMRHWKALSNELFPLAPKLK